MQSPCKVLELELQILELWRITCCQTQPTSKIFPLFKFQASVFLNLINLKENSTRLKSLSALQTTREMTKMRIPSLLEIARSYQKLENVQLLRGATMYLSRAYKYTGYTEVVFDIIRIHLVYLLSFFEAMHMIYLHTIF